MSRQAQKYNQLALALQNDTFQGEYAQSAAFFFKNIQHLDADLLLNQIQIAEQQKQIRTLQEKLGLIREEQRIFENQSRRIVEQSSEGIFKDFCCSHKDCNKRFQKQSGVKIHNLLMHSSSQKLKDSGIFKLELMPDEDLA